jgi:hypothetical protein
VLEAFRRNQNFIATAGNQKILDHPARRTDNMLTALSLSFEGLLKVNLEIIKPIHKPVLLSLWLGFGGHLEVTSPTQHSIFTKTNIHSVSKEIAHNRSQIVIFRQLNHKDNAAKTNTFIKNVFLHKLLHVSTQRDHQQTHMYKRMAVNDL